MCSGNCLHCKGGGHQLANKWVTTVDRHVDAVSPAGGNSFLQPGANLTLAGIASGQGLSALAAAALPQLLQQLAGLAAPLAALAVQLRRCTTTAHASSCQSSLTAVAAAAAALIVYDLQSYMLTVSWTCLHFTKSSQTG